MHDFEVNLLFAPGNIQQGKEIVIQFLIIIFKIYFNLLSNSTLKCRLSRVKAANEANKRNKIISLRIFPGTYWNFLKRLWCRVPLNDWSNVMNETLPLPPQRPKQSYISILTMIYRGYLCKVIPPTRQFDSSTYSVM